MIDRNIEESLNLSGMKIHRNHPGNAGSRHQVSNQFGRNRFAATGLAVLTGISIIRHNCRNVTGRSTFQRICHNQQFHQRIIGRLTCRLNDENILAADTFINHNLNFTVVEFADKSLAQFQAKVVCNFFCQFRIGITCKNFQLFPVFVTHGEPPN